MKANKNMLATIVGCISCLVVINIGELILGYLFPFPPNIDRYNKAIIAQAMSLMPKAALVLLLVVYAIASLSGGIIATIISGKTKASPAISVGFVLTILGIHNTWVLPHPIWFNIINAVLYLPFAYLPYIALKQKAQSPSI